MSGSDKFTKGGYLNNLTSHEEIPEGEDKSEVVFKNGAVYKG